MNTILTQKGEGNLGKILEDIKEKIDRFKSAYFYYIC